MSTDLASSGAVQALRLRVDRSAQPGRPNHSLAESVVKTPSATSISAAGGSSRTAQPPGESPTVLRDKRRSVARWPFGAR